MATSLKDLRQSDAYLSMLYKTLRQQPLNAEELQALKEAQGYMNKRKSPVQPAPELNAEQAVIKAAKGRGPTGE